MNGLIFPDDLLNSLRAELLSSAPNEAAAILLAGPAVTKERVRLLVRERHLVPPEHYIAQEELRIELSPNFLMPLLKRARNEGWSLILSHTHPFGDQAQFSHIDDAGEAATMPVLFRRTKGQPHGSLVLGGKDCAGRIYEANHPALKQNEAHVAEVGQNIHTCSQSTGLKDHVAQRFDRNVRAFGAMGQAILSSMTIGIVGLGGIGSIVAEQLAHLGVGQFVLLDPDTLEETNLNCVVGGVREELGAPKVSLAEKLIRRINPDAKVRAINGDIMFARDASALLDVDFLFGCTDSHGSRTVLNQMAYQYMIPAIDLGIHVQARSGTIQAIAGRVQMLAPGLACLVCSNLLDLEEVRRDFLSVEARKRDPYISGAVEPQPAVISLNGCVASFGVTMMLSAVVGIPLSARHQIIRFDRGIVRPVAQPPQSDCIVCSLRGALGRGDLWPLPNKPC